MDIDTPFWSRIAHRMIECLCLDCIQYFAIGGYLKLNIDSMEPGSQFAICFSFEID